MKNTVSCLSAILCLICGLALLCSCLTIQSEADKPPTNAALLSTWSGKSWDSAAKNKQKGSVLFVKLFADGTAQIKNHSISDNVTTVGVGGYTLSGASFSVDVTAMHQGHAYRLVTGGLLFSDLGTASGTYTLYRDGVFYDKGYWELKKQQ